jgi:hypothetical protein
MTTLPNTVGPSGQILITQGPAMYQDVPQKMEGGPIEAAANKTIASQATQVEATKALGAGQKGSSRRKHKSKKNKKRSKKRRLRGGASTLNAIIPQIPTANSIPGVSNTQLHLNAVNNLNQIRTDASYDNLINAQPRQIAGLRFRDAEELYPGSGTHEDTKGGRKTNGRRHNRTHRRGNRKSSTRRRGVRRVL